MWLCFRHPVTGADYIKRLVGLPGDKIQMQGGVLQINGTPVERRQVEDFVEIFEPQGSQRNRPGLFQWWPLGWAQIASRRNISRRCPMALSMASLGHP